MCDINQNSREKIKCDDATIPSNGDDNKLFGLNDQEQEYHKWRVTINTSNCTIYIFQNDFIFDFGEREIVRLQRPVLLFIHS